MLQYFQHCTEKSTIFKPRRTCAVRVAVVILCVCVYVSVCALASTLSICKAKSRIVGDIWKVFACKFSR